MEAAVSSFVLFAFGAVIPVLPFFFMGGMNAIILSAASSAVGLFIIGASITLFTGKSVLYSGMRQVVFGLIAAAITFGIGHFIGISLAG
jgi:VIT1/CCC1 family predicted Fe2+/Mn2+ transporter